MTTSGAVSDHPARRRPRRGLQCGDRFGVGGLEVDRTPFTEVFARARAAGLRSMPHAGETSGPESVWVALDDLGAERVGHGINSVDDPALLARLAADQVPLEVCPTSNLRTRAVGSLAEHPMRRLREAGMPITVASDDPPMFNTTLVREYHAAAQLLGLDAAGVAAVSKVERRVASNVAGYSVIRRLAVTSTRHAGTKPTCYSEEPTPNDTPCRDDMAITATASEVSHS